MSVYKNGNTIVKISEDGTKIRYIPDNVTPQPLFPESMDVKITNCCEMGCPQCHEQSVPDGKHGDLNHPILNTIHPYTEIAIGGGDPMSHPGLEDFLRRMKEQKVFSNITVHWNAFLTQFDTLIKYKNEGLVHGIGISINEHVPCEIIHKLSTISGTVVHCILGIADENIFRQLMDRDLNILLLGYKTYGRGALYRTKYGPEIAERINWVKEHLNEFPDHFRAVSFDNLAIEQTELKLRMKPEAYNQFYMGEDGMFTMYLDLTENKYATSSTKKRYDIDEGNIDDLFAKVRKREGYAY